MALFVPILRLLMLFLNVYDSYKTLKDPPSSSRHPGRPSIRAATQRKRDMKGCLALWVVWACISMYERTLESVVCLFIPFYDEVKSLALLFLILTRAKGAEPIYLHFIRPLIKPYTRTLDASLDLALMIGDFVFALSTYPVHVAIEWYGKQFGNFEVQDSEETQSDSSSSNGVNTSELPTSFLVSSGVAQAPAENDTPQPAETTKEKTPTAPPTRRTSADTVPSRHAAGKRRVEIPDPANLEPSFFDSKRAREPLNRGSRASAHKEPKPFPRHRSSGDSANQTAGKSTIQPDGKGSSSRHQIWYPPKLDDDEHGEVDVTIMPEKVDHAAVLAFEHQQYEEWRQYPPFPSAYPPTPLVTTSRLISTSVGVSSTLHAPIAEENQQDFRRSLLPPREPLNPIHIRDLSDVYTTTGISSLQDMDDADDSMSNDDDDGEEDEDDFNITLRTPLSALGSLRSQIQPRRLVSVTSNSSGMSIPSRSSALTTANDGSSVPHRPSSDSSLSPPKPNNTTTSVIGKKRSYPRPKMPLGRNRVRQVEDETSQDPSSLSDRDLQENLNTATLTLKAPERPTGLLKLPDESESASPSSLSAAEQEEQIPPEEKRRKIVRSATNTGRAVHPPRTVRSRVVVPPSSSSSSAQPQTMRVDGLPMTMKRSSTRLRPTSGPITTQKIKENDPSLSGSSSASLSLGDSGPGSRLVAHTSKPGRRAAARKQ